MSEQSLAKCFNCENEGSAGDMFCHGCKQYVCEECSVNYNLPFGGHEPEDHLEDPLEEDE